MDAFHRREFDRLIREGRRNHAPWDYVKRSIWRLARHFRTNSHGSPTDYDVEEYLRKCEEDLSW